MNSKFLLAIIALSVLAYAFLSVYSAARDTGFSEGSAAGFAAGLKSKVPQPKIIVVRPPCTEGPAEKSDSLWRL